MVAVKNIENKDLELPFDGNTYFFPKGKTVLVKEPLAGHMAEIWPLAFEYGVEVKKGEVLAEPRFTKTKSIFAQVKNDEIDMRVSSSKMEADQFETEDPSEYGAGVQLDTI